MERERRDPPTETGAARCAPGDFDFLDGTWRVSHRKLRQGGAGATDWDVLEGEATCWSALGGAASIEELRVPARGFSGLGIRLLDVARCLWADHWVSSRTGVLALPPMWGGFAGGVGTFVADELEGDVPIRVRGVWDQITETSCRWRQAASRDGGQIWEENWVMEWVRV